MLYGHIETVRERLEHMVALRELQDRTGGFICFIPLAFQPANNQLSHLPPTTGIDDLKTIAVSRLMLDNISHIKAYWVMLSVKIRPGRALLSAQTISTERWSRKKSATWQGQSLSRE